MELADVRPIRRADSPNDKCWGAPFSPFALASSLRRRDVRAQQFAFVPHQLTVIAPPG